MKNGKNDTYRVEIRGESYEVSFTDEPGVALINNERVEFDIQMESPPEHYSILLDNKSAIVGIEEEDELGKYRVHAGGFDFSTEVISSREAYLRDFIRAAGASGKQKLTKAPMPGLIIKLLIEKGSQVSAGQGILIMEAMKMENEIKAPANGILKNVHVETGQAVEKGQILFEID